MNELKKFLSLVKRFKYVLLAIPLLAIIITYFLVSSMPDTFSSQARISTGLVDRTQASSLSDGSSRPQGMELQQQFSNLVELIQMKAVLDRVSYRLILHDLESKQPFRSESKYYASLDPTTKRASIKLFKEKLNHPVALAGNEKNEDILQKILRSYRYDSESVRKGLRVYHAGESDFINIDFETDNPQLSAFVANTVAREFIHFNESATRDAELRETGVLKRLIDQKRTDLNSAVDSLKQYKIKNRVLNLNEQSSQLYAQIIEYNNQKQAILKDIAANSGAVGEINSKFNPNERKYLESTISSLNQRIIGTKTQLQNMYDKYIQSNFEPAYKNSIDSLQRILNVEIGNTNDTYAYNPLAAKEALVQQRLTLEIQLDLSRYSLSTIEKELADLNGSFDNMVPHEAIVQSLERDVEVASNEYLDVLGKYNTQSIASQFNASLTVAQYALPGAPQPNKKMLLVLISGVVSFIFCLLVVFVIFLFDQSIVSAEDLANKTRQRVIGRFGKFKAGEIDLSRLWENNPDKSRKNDIGFKEDLRALRFQLENFMTGQILSVTSPRINEGKTFTSLSLAYAFKMVNKRVLLIDGNFQNPSVTQSVNAQTGIYVEDFFSGKISEERLDDKSFISILANKGHDTSLLELNTEDGISAAFVSLKKKFDIIIIDTPSLLHNTQSREWVKFSDAILGVFESGRALNAQTKDDVDFLTERQEKFCGWLLNKAELDKS